MSPDRGAWPLCTATHTAERHMQAVGVPEFGADAGAELTGASWLAGGSFLQWLHAARERKLVISRRGKTRATPRSS
jgi:hypothetical protein